MPLDGDMAGGIVPANDVKQILTDPLGISVIKTNAIYPNPNRFFAHWAFYKYFSNVPVLLQNFVNPIDSVYLAAALAKIVLQLLLLTILCFYITGKTKILSFDFLVAAVLVAPFFQTNGYRHYMGIIDPSITYTFFYALPCALLLMFYFSFFRNSGYKEMFPQNRVLLILLFLLSIFVSLNGPLVPGIVLTITLTFFLKKWKEGNKNKMGLNVFKHIPKAYSILFVLISLFCIYSLFIGVNNSIFLEESLPVSTRYLRIPMGIYKILTQKIGFPVLIIAIVINIFLVSRYFKNPETRGMIGFFKWIALFSLLYIILLPFGGYKNYRPNIIRYDTFIPVTIAMVFIYSRSAYYLLQNSVEKFRNLYLVLVILVAFIFSFADKPEFEKNKCEKEALQKMANATEDIVFIDSDCTVLSWNKITDPKKSELNAQLLHKWRITTSKKLYYQK